MSVAPTGDGPFLSGGLSSSGALGLGSLAIGGAGLGYLLSQGEPPLPTEFGQLTANVPGMEAQAQTLFGEGQGLTTQGTQALEMAQKGELTPEQQAQLKLYQGGLTNTAQQTFASMGRNINQDTSGISAQGNIDTQVNAMAQQQIQSTIALGLGELSAGSNMTGQALSFENAADSALIAAGQAQIQQDKSYSDSLTSVFSSIGNILGGAVKLAPMLSDAMVKTDIVPIGRLPSGVGLYSFRFKWDWTPYVGVIAQQVWEVAPEAVTRAADGLLRVDYSRIRAPFMTLVEWKNRCQ